MPTCLPGRSCFPEALRCARSRKPLANNLQADGTLDRKKLGEWIFADPEDRQKLNQIVHTKIRPLSAQRLQEASDRTSADYVMYDAALLVEEGIHKQLWALVVVAASEEKQITRCMQRDHISREAAVARIRAQLPLAEKLRVADHVVDNDGSVEHTQGQVQDVDRKLRNSLASFNTST